MKLNELAPAPGSRREANRKGQGMGSGNGKTAGRGTKGQHARSGGFHKLGFEGGQMSLQRRMPKYGMFSRNRKVFALVKLSDLELKFETGAEIRIADLISKGIIRKHYGDGVKLLSDGDLTKKFAIFVDKASKIALEKVQAAGGSVTLSVAPSDQESSAS